MDSGMKALLGNTYPYKDIIREKGGKWDPKVKHWLVPADMLDELQKLVNSSKKSVHLSGQIWEECDFCGGHGPVYMSAGMRCERCAR